MCHRAVQRTTFHDILQHRPQRDLLMVGIALVGVSIALSGVPDLIQAGAKAIWCAEAVWTATVLASTQQSSPVLATSTVKFAVESVAAMLA